MPLDCYRHMTEEQRTCRRLSFGFKQLSLGEDDPLSEEERFGGYNPDKLRRIVDVYTFRGRKDPRQSKS